jgi:hypothetical protein
MPFPRALCVLSLVVLLPARESAAQETLVPATPPVTVQIPAGKGDSKMASERNVRVDVSISLKGETKPITKNLSMVAADGKNSSVRAGIEIPVPNEPTVITGSPTPAPAGYHYRSVGVNVDTYTQILDATHVMVRLKWQFSTVYKTETTSNGPPSFGAGSHDSTGIVFESGKPIVVSQAADGESGREYTVQVTATILK